VWGCFRYSALDATRLINVFTELFHCENCQTELVEESDKFAVAAPADVADGEDNARRRRREKLKDLLEKLDVRLHALVFLLLLRLQLSAVYRFALLYKFDHQIDARREPTCCDHFLRLLINSRLISALIHLLF
jgi:hypothetical protein